MPVFRLLSRPPLFHDPLEDLVGVVNDVVDVVPLGRYANVPPWAVPILAERNTTIVALRPTTALFSGHAALLFRGGANFIGRAFQNLQQISL